MWPPICRDVIFRGGSTLWWGPWRSQRSLCNLCPKNVWVQLDPLNYVKNTYIYTYTYIDILTLRIVKSTRYGMTTTNIYLLACLCHAVQRTYRFGWSFITKTYGLYYPVYYKDSHDILHCRIPILPRIQLVGGKNIKNKSDILLTLLK